MQLRILTPVLLFLTLLVSAAPPAAAQSATVAEANSLEELVNADDYNYTSHTQVLRLYQAVFNREPDLAGAKYWIDVTNQGFDAVEIAGFMAGSDEWESFYAGADDEEFVTRVYRNMLGRGPDTAGFNYWHGLISAGELSRSEMAFYVTANLEFITLYPFTPEGAAWSVNDLVGVKLGTAGTPRGDNGGRAGRALLDNGLALTQVIDDTACVETQFQHPHWPLFGTGAVTINYASTNVFARFVVADGSLTGPNGFIIGVNSLNQLRAVIPELPAPTGTESMAELERDGIEVRVRVLINATGTVESVEIQLLDAPLCYPALD